MPTGAGKSICYQIPATLLPGMTIVISPLISLMRDQVDALNDVGIPAAFINTTQSPDEQDLVFAQALSGRIRLLYVAPERLETERFRTFASRVPISLVRSVTDTSIIFITPIPPTKREIPAINAIVSAIF